MLPIVTNATDSLSVNAHEEIAEMVRNGHFKDLGDHILTWGIDFVGKLILAFIIFFIGKWLIKKVRNFIIKLMSKKSMSNSLKNFLKSILDILLYVLLIMMIINVVGVQTVSLAALIGSIGLAIGLAVKDNLANFAGGVMLLFNKPFKDGDYIEVQNLAGKVQSIGVLYTTLTTPDNKTVFIPNGPLSTGNIVNYNTQTMRRIDLVINMEYGSDLNFIKNMLLDIINKHPKTLRDPEPFVRMTKLNQSTIDFTMRVWVNVDDYWDVLFDLNEEVYRRGNENGVNFPFPQLTVHLAKPNDEGDKNETSGKR